MQDTITLQEVIRIMDAGDTFAIGFRTRNESRDTGGEWIEFSQARKHIRLTPAEIAAADNPRELKLKKDPKHFENSTRNIVVISSGKIIKVHLRLIRRFNLKTVL